MFLKLFHYLLIPLIPSLLCGGDHTILEFGPKSSRHLTSRSKTLSPIRLSYFYYNFTLNNPSLDSEFKLTLMNLIDLFFTTTLKVYPLESNLKLSTSSCLSAVKVPLEHKTTGVSNTDVLIYITTNHLTDVSYVAYAGACETDQYGLGNVLAGTVVINVPNFSDNSMEEWLANLAHEMTHLLGFSSALFDDWRDANGQVYLTGQVKRKVTVRGVEKSVLVTPNVLEKARAAFNCMSLEGVELEEAGGSGTAGSHWDKRVMMNDYMTSYIPSDGIFSDVSLAVFKDTGWYDVDFTLAQVPYFGRNAGCEFFDKKCIEDERSFNRTMWCVNDTKWGCDFFGINKGGCSLKNYSESLPKEMQYFKETSALGGKDRYTDYCPFYMPLDNGKCRGGGAYPTKVFVNSYEVVGQNSKCFESTLMKKPYKVSGSNYAACYEVVDCNSTKVTVKIGNETVFCGYDGRNLTLSGWNGWFKCPTDKRICADIPCKSYCYARGSCSGRGICSCFPGYSGDYCEITCSPNCKACSSTSNCSSCISPYSLKSSNCCPSNCEFCNISSHCQSCSEGFQESEGKCLPCKEGFFKSEEKCLKCQSHCQECLNPFNCIKCESGFSLTSSKCCPNNCLKCDSSSNCLECLPGFDLEKTCKTCLKGFYLTEGICEACLSNCEKCSNNSICETCSSKFKKIQKFCCPFNCLICDAFSSCLECSSNFYLSNESFLPSCLNCPEKCLRCKNLTFCEECEDPFAVSDNFGRCSCESGFFESTEGRCAPCFSECETCSSKFTCLKCRTRGAVPSPKGCECLEGFFNQSGCQPCREDCLTCDSEKTCIKCKDQKVFNFTSGNCECKERLFLDKDGKCLPCVETCSACDGLGCKECRDNNADPFSDCRCKSGYFLDGISCILCPVFCRECEDFFKCSKCLVKNTFPENNCLCDEISMKVEKENCVCREGFDYYQKEEFSCFKCFRWVQKSDVELNLRSNFFEVEVFFNSSLKMSLENISFALDPSSVSILGDSFKEFKISPGLFLLQLGQNNEIFMKNLTFNFSLWFSDFSECGFEPQGLIETFTKKPKDLPFPSAVIKAPEKFGYSCELTENFFISAELSTGGLGRDLSCFWDFYPNINLPSSLLNTCTFQINSQQVESISELKIFLTVKNYLEKANSTEKIIKIKKIVDIYVDLTENSSCSPSQKCVIFIDKVSKCSSSQKLSYEWILMNRNNEGLKILQKNDDLPMMIVEPHTLKPGLWTFKLNVIQSGENIESLEGQVEVFPQAPRIVLNRAPGDVSTLNDLLLDASLSFDTNLKGEISVECQWKCFNGLNPCDFNFESENCQVKIPKIFLKSDKMSHLVIKTTSKDYKISSEKVFKINFVDFEVPLVTMFEWKSKKLMKKIPLFESSRIQALVNSTEIKSVKWLINNRLLSTDYFVDFSPARLGLTQGTIFQLNFDLTSLNSEISSFYEEFVINSPPLFGSLKVSPDSGKELITEFFITAKNWKDDEEDFPLQYFFAYESESTRFPLKSSQSNFLTTTLSYIGNSTKVTCRVSDSLGDYTEVKTEVKIMKTQNNVKKYMKQNQIIEPETNIPLVIGNVLAFMQKEQDFEWSDKETQEFYKEIFEYCQEKILRFIQISQADENFADIVLDFLLKLSLNPFIREKFLVKSRPEIFSDFLKKMSKIGLSKNQGVGLLEVLESFCEINDEVVRKITGDFQGIMENVEDIHLLVLRQMKEGQTVQINTKKMFSYLSVKKFRDFNGFSFKNSDFSVSLPSQALSFKTFEDFSIGFITSYFKVTPKMNSSHELVTLSAYNITGLKKLEVNLNEKEILIEIPINFTEFVYENEKCCYLNSSLGWDDYGCEVINFNEKSVVCGCNHLSIFSFVPETELETEQSESHRDKKFTVETFKTPGFLLCFSLFLLYGLLQLRVMMRMYHEKKLELKKNQINLEESKEQHNQTEIYSEQRIIVSFEKESKSESRIVDEDASKKNEDIVIEMQENKLEDNKNEFDQKNMFENRCNIQSKYSSNIFFDKFHDFHILISVKVYQNHYFLLTRTFFIFYILLLFDSFYFDYKYRSKSVKNFEDFLNENIIIFNFITIVLSALASICAKLLVSFFMILILHLKQEKLKYIILNILLIFVYFSLIYLISCNSYGFTEYVNKVWVVCAINSIILEIFLFDPMIQSILSLIRYFYLKLKYSSNEEIRN